MEWNTHALVRLVYLHRFVYFYVCGPLPSSAHICMKYAMKHIELLDLLSNRCYDTYTVYVGQRPHRPITVSDIELRPSPDLFVKHRCN